MWLEIPLNTGGTPVLRSEGRSIRFAPVCTRWAATDTPSGASERAAIVRDFAHLGMPSVEVRVHDGCVQARLPSGSEYHFEFMP